MAIQTLTTDGMLHWACAGGEEDEHCNAQLSCHVSEVSYRLAQNGPRGAMIDLPPCSQCGTRCSLKADHNMKELLRATNTLTDASGGIIGYALRIEHVHSLLVHHWLHQNGLAEHPPALAMPSLEDLSDPTIKALPGTAALALWWGYATVRARDPRLESFTMITQELGALPAGEERKSLDGAA